CAHRLGAVHWAPCYGRDPSVPVLLDGARALRSLGSTVIKVALFRPGWNYAINSHWPPDDAFPTLRSVAEHPQFRALWEMDFTTYVLVAYSTAGGLSESNLAAGYWVEGLSQDQAAAEERQFYDAALFFIESFPQKTFVFANCEGDW
ncbi:unnamed protein product, partial [Symbiodinium microadriaticum]